MSDYPITYLEFFRRWHFLDQKKFAAMCGISVGALQKLENGNSGGYKPERFHEMVWRITYRLSQHKGFQTDFKPLLGLNLCQFVGHGPMYFTIPPGRRHEDPSVRISPFWKQWHRGKDLWWRVFLENGLNVPVADTSKDLYKLPHTSPWELANRLPEVLNTSHEINTDQDLGKGEKEETGSGSKVVDDEAA
jgi:transcriptional regulator with XRE-family HTH domain